MFFLKHLSEPKFKKFNSIFIIWGGVGVVVAASVTAFLWIKQLCGVTCKGSGERI